LHENVPLKRHPRLSVALPASVVSDVPHLREKTSKIGFVGRALAMFRVDEVIVFSDAQAQSQPRDVELVATLLSYLETPQYLRKRLFRIQPELSFGGILPPLRTPHHPLQNRERDLSIGEIREGAVVSRSGNGVLVDVGVERPIMVPNANASADSRVTVKILDKGKQFVGQLVPPDGVDSYWGYKVTVADKPLGQMMKDGAFGLVVATSRLGEPFMNVADKIRAEWTKSKSVLVAFGSPSKGLHEILRQENLDLADVADFVVNTVPNQATETVRTEEALYATLAALNLLTPE
jgi:predicted SPOUT superfamily RNA methylase MTH1